MGRHIEPSQRDQPTNSCETENANHKLQFRESNRTSSWTFSSLTFFFFSITLVGKGFLSPIQWPSLSVSPYQNSPMVDEPHSYYLKRGLSLSDGTSPGCVPIEVTHQSTHGQEAKIRLKSRMFPFLFLFFSSCQDCLFVHDLMCPTPRWPFP